MLPAGHVFAEQVPLRGSRITVQGAGADEPAGVEPHEGAVASHFIAAFGPAAEALRGGAAMFEADQRGERDWTRRRESYLHGLETEVVTLRAFVAERDEWRRYIHELEDRLGLPRAGGEMADQRPGGS
jgi:hypothetical protein